ncbi:rhamnose ABC transporter substrate-binding protein [soil metagenome]
MFASRKLCLVVATAAIAMVGCDKSEKGTAPSSSSTKMYTIGFMPKQKGMKYFTSCDQGAQEAAKELKDVTLVYDGPTDGDATKAADLVGQWALQGFDAIAVSAADPKVLGPAMKKAQDQGVKTLAWDADVAPEDRSFFVSQATAEEIGNTLVDTMANDLQSTGDVAIISANETAANQNDWIKYMKQRLEKYPQMKLVAIEYPGEDQDKALSAAKTLMKAYPNLKGMFGISSASFPAAAEAVRQEGKSGKVLVTGLSTPDPMKPYVKDGTVRSVVLWNTQDLGYLSVYAAEALCKGTLKPGDTTFHAGRLGDKTIVGSTILLGQILVFTKTNIDQYDF